MSKGGTRRRFLASSISSFSLVAAPAAVGAGRSLSFRDSAGSRKMDTDKQTKHDLATPALVLDLEAFEKNVARMSAHAKASSRALRPHAKTHKCPEIARAQVRAGASGICVGTLYEAEVMAAHGVRGLLLTSELVGRPKLQRLMKLMRSAPDLMVVADSVAGANELSEAAAAARLDLNVMVDLNVGGRTGVAAGQPAVELVQHLVKLPRIKFRGIQAYAGQASHTMGFEKRRDVSRNVMGTAVETRQLLEKAGIATPLLTGGSTGTYNIDSSIDGITELQPGSYVFMDVDYRRIGGQSGEVYTDFAPSLSVIGTVISHPGPKTAIVDAGLKAFSTDRAFGPEVVGLRGVKYAFAGDEHGRLDLTDAERDVKIGERLEFIIPHCDPSVNLYDRMYALRGERIDAVWSVAARGYLA